MKKLCIIAAMLVATIYPSNIHSTVLKYQYFNVEDLNNHREMVIQRTAPVVNRNDAVCMAKVIFYEAKGEPVEGKIAVGHVVINRTTHPEFKGNICQVVYQRDHRLCQFSWTCWERRSRTPSGDEWNESFHVANVILSGYHLEDKTRGAVYFKSSKLWNKKDRRQYTIIGNHVFYNN